MPAGEITGYIDVAQVALYVFWVFFAGLIIYLRREDRREGYPLETETSAGRITYNPPAWIPSPKTFRLPHGGTVTVPAAPDSREIRAVPAAVWPGAPLQPTGNPMLDGVGPASYAQRADVPDMTIDGQPAIVPLRVATECSVDPEDADPRGMTLVGADGKAGVVTDAWIDRTEPQIRYLEAEVPVAEGTRQVLIPIVMVDSIDGDRREITVKALLAKQFADVPALANPTQVTKLEEDRVTGYYAGGTLYATPSRTESWL